MSVQAAAGYPQYSGGFIPEVWSSTLNINFYEATVITEITNTNWEGEIAGQGDIVNIRQTPSTPTQKHQKGQQVTYTHLEADKIQLEIDKARSFAYAADDIDLYQSDINLLDDWAEGAALQMQADIDEEFLSVVYADAASENSGNSAGAKSSSFDMGSSASPKTLTKNNVLDWLVDVNSVLGENNIPTMYRWIVLPEWACGLIEKSELKDASLTGDDMSTLRNDGYLGRISSLSLYRSNLLNASSGKYDVIFGHISAIAFASQYVDVQYFDKLENIFGQAVRGLNVYGYKTVKSQALGHAVIQQG
ncbi:MAG TPA: hypothetical protein VK973_03325 [Arenicellales bacterium]|nr:hypothetical protein [Arenicellales bacterium]